MTKYKISVWTQTFVRHEETEDVRDINQLKKSAHDFAVKCLPWSQYPEEVKHLVYYYEIPGKDCTEVTVRTDNPLMTDEDFDRFVDYWNPLYVGAIHRQE